MIAIVWLDPDHQFGVVKPRHPCRIGEHGRRILGPRRVSSRGQPDVGSPDFIKEESARKSSPRDALNREKACEGKGDDSRLNYPDRGCRFPLCRILNREKMRIHYAWQRPHPRPSFSPKAAGEGQRHARERRTNRVRPLSVTLARGGRAINPDSFVTAHENR